MPAIKDLFFNVVDFMGISNYARSAHAPRAHTARRCFGVPPKPARVCRSDMLLCLPSQACCLGCFALTHAAWLLCRAGPEPTPRQLESAIDKYRNELMVMGIDFDALLKKKK